MLLTIPKITVKSGREITRFSPTGLVFDDGSRVEADLVVFATGYVIYAADRTGPHAVAPGTRGPRSNKLPRAYLGWRLQRVFVTLEGGIMTVSLQAFGDRLDVSRLVKSIAISDILTVIL